MNLLELRAVSSTPVEIEAVELLKWERQYFLRTRSMDGAEGIAKTNGRAAYLYPILQQLVAPFFIGKDARDLETLVDDVYTHRSNYKLAGLALWNCVAYVELSLFDMLGKIAEKPVGELLGGVIRTEIPVYLSSLRRDTTPDEEVAWIAERLKTTGASAVKLKVGGRMSDNADASPGRTDALIPLARKTFGADVTIYVDGNGSYDSAGAIEVGKMLDDYGVAFFEEPCPFDEYEETKRVSDALTLPVAGGEQDTSAARFRWMIENRGVDVVQPDIVYNGGFIRTLRVARLAAEHGMNATPHGPSADPVTGYILHYASATPNAGPHQEYRGEGTGGALWYSPSLDVENGVLTVPTGPGLGFEYDPSIWRRAVALES